MRKLIFNNFNNNSEIPCYINYIILTFNPLNEAWAKKFKYNIIICNTFYSGTILNNVNYTFNILHYNKTRMSRVTVCHVYHRKRIKNNNIIVLLEHRFKK